MLQCRDVDAKSALDQFTQSLNTARDNLKAEEARLEMITNGIEALQPKLQASEELKLATNNAIQSLEIECARAEQMSLCRQKAYDEMHSSLEQLDAEKSLSMGRIEEFKESLMSQRETYIDSGIYRCRLLLKLLKECDEDEQKRAFEQKQKEVLFLKNKLQKLRETVAAHQPSFSTNRISNFQDQEASALSSRVETMKQRYEKQEAERNETLRSLEHERDSRQLHLDSLRREGNEIELGIIDGLRRLETLMDAFPPNCSSCTVPVLTISQQKFIYQDDEA